MVEKIYLCRVLVGKPLGKCILDTPRQRLEAKINVDIRTTDYADQRWMQLAQDYVQ
jgi:hypothetical protein